MKHGEIEKKPSFRAFAWFTINSNKRRYSQVGDASAVAAAVAIET